jgi:hypothetical protein
MASMKLTIITIFTILALPAFGQSKLPDELPDQEAINAFKQYWSAFESYEDKTLNEGRKQYKKAWQEVQSRYNKERKKLNSEQIAVLTKAAKNYKKQIENHPNAENRPYVMLNLAQILNMLADHYSLDDVNAGSFTKNDALILLKDIEDDYKRFEQREKTLYLRALILESLNKREEAQTVWKILAAIAKKSLYGVHARLAVGDNYFRIENPAAAMRYYQGALELLPDVESSDEDYEELRINYRLAWAAYRAAELDETIKAASSLLQPGQSLKSSNRIAKIQEDAVELIGNSLYEGGSLSKTKKFLLRRELKRFSADIGLRILVRFNGSNVHSEAVKIGEFLGEKFPLSKSAPQILHLTADSFKRIKQHTKRIEFLEKLALLLPSQSLWRARHRGDFESITAMEKTARNAAVVTAGWHYDRALASNNNRIFMTAASFFELLIESEPNGNDANSWRLRFAHCHYFAGRYKEAGILYQDLKSNYKVDPRDLQIASYQLVLTNEKFWREMYSQAIQQDQNPVEDKEALQALTKLERSVDEFGARFPAQSRSVDLLLVGASANRDMERFERAANYWQRVMVSKPNNAQRGIAIRGLVFSSMKNGSSADVIQIAGKFLKLEDWKSLGLNLGKELQGILSIAALDEGKRLNNKGDIKKAGHMLIKIAQEFPNLPNRDKIYRDGAYMLAISGEWEATESAVAGYMKSGLKKSIADMTYLEARSHEYQMKMAKAYKAYLVLGKKFPKHSRARIGLERAEKLSLAEGDYKSAADASSLLAERSASPKTRLRHYSRTIDHLEKADSPKAALAIANRRLKSSRTTAERFTSKIMVARMMYVVGHEQEALDDLRIISKRIRQKREKLSKKEYGAAIGETHFLLGLEAKNKFDDFHLTDRGGNIRKNIAHKSRYFDSLATEMDKSAAGAHPDWAPRARYILAISAENLADEIASATIKNGNGADRTTVKAYRVSIERLQKIAKKYHSTNVLISRKNPGQYRNNKWTNRSSMRLGGTDKSGHKNNFRDELPTALGTDMPSQWSL